MTPKTMAHGAPGSMPSIGGPSGVTVVLLTSCALAAGGMARPAQLAAQDDAAVAVTSPSCWHGRPLPTCAGFWLVEAQGVLPLGTSGGPSDTFDDLLEWNLGYMTNVSPDWAVGGAISLGPGAAGALGGLRVRVRRWVGPTLSVELQGGLVRRGRGGLGGADHGISADARLNVADQGSLFVRWDGVFLPERVDWNGETHPAAFARAFQVGLGTGSTCTLFATGLLGMMFVMVLSAWGASS